MKSTVTMLLAFVLTANSYAQSTQLPMVGIKDMLGREQAFHTLFDKNSDTVYIVSLWATWCGPCVRELDAISESLPDWQQQSPIKLIGVATDDSRTASRVKGFVAGRGWDFSIYTDVNNDLKRALNVSNIPFLFLIKNGKIVYQKDGYVPGNEDELLEKIQQLKSK